MKNYEKPRLMFLSLSGNDQLCGSCADMMVKYPDKQGILLGQDPTGELAQNIDMMIGNRDRVLSREEGLMAFGADESCARQINGYCKFTAMDLGQKVAAWS